MQLSLILLLISVLLTLLGKLVIGVGYDEFKQVQVDGNGWVAEKSLKLG